MASTVDPRSDAPRRGRGRPPRTAHERAAQRARLVEGAMEAVRRYGPDATIAQMAEVAGVSKPVMFAEFGEKLGVADAIALVLADRVERDAIALLASGEGFTAASAIESMVDALVSLIASKPELYEFIVRSIRTTDRGFLDNALVRVIHERALLVIGVVTPGVNRDEVEVLTDGVFGFLLGAVESWQGRGEPTQERLVEVLSSVLLASLADVTARVTAEQG